MLLLVLVIQFLILHGGDGIIQILKLMIKMVIKTMIMVQKVGYLLEMKLVNGFKLHFQVLKLLLKLRQEVDLIVHNGLKVIN